MGDFCQGGLLPGRRSTFSGGLYDCPDPLRVGFTMKVPESNHVFLISKLLGSAQARVSHTYSLIDLVLPTPGGATESSLSHD